MKDEDLKKIRESAKDYEYAVIQVSERKFVVGKRSTSGVYAYDYFADTPYDPTHMLASVEYTILTKKLNYFDARAVYTKLVLGVDLGDDEKLLLGSARIGRL